VAITTKGTGPWIVPSGDAGNTPVTAEVIQIDRLEWDTGTAGAADDECKVTTNDATPVVLADFHASAKDQLITTRVQKLPINGLIVPTMTHGTLYVYLR
jgi:hypothetical protein